MMTALREWTVSNPVAFIFTAGFVGFLIGDSAADETGGTGGFLVGLTLGFGVFALARFESAGVQIRRGQSDRQLLISAVQSGTLPGPMNVRAPSKRAEPSTHNLTVTTSRQSDWGKQESAAGTHWDTSVIETEVDDRVMSEIVVRLAKAEPSEAATILELLKKQGIGL